MQIFDGILHGIGTVLAWCSGWTGSFAIALIFYALVFKIVFLPFSIKQQKSQIKMAKLAPKIALIKAKYKGRNDQVTLRKQQEEIMALQQSEGYSPLSGCLPLLVQMPIVIFLWNVIRSPLYYMANFTADHVEACYRVINNIAAGEAIKDTIDQIALAGQIDANVMIGANAMLGEGVAPITQEMLNRIPNMQLGVFNLAENPAFHGFSIASIILLLPFVAAGLQWFTMWVSKKLGNNPQAAAGMAGDTNPQSKVSMLMLELMGPAMTLFFTFSLPGLLGIYWIYQSIFTIFQTLIISKIWPIPKYTEEELNEMRKAQKQAEKAQKEIIKSQPKYKSLHYIDDDDYEELKEIKSNTPQNNKGSLSDKPEIKD